DAGRRHLIPLSLGGSNSIRNLWPQSYRTSPWNAHVKDVLERRLHNLVCAEKVDLQTAQHEIATDWIKAYQKYVAKSPPASDMHEVFDDPDGNMIEVYWPTGKHVKQPCLKPLDLSQSDEAILASIATETVLPTEIPF